MVDNNKKAYHTIVIFFHTTYSKSVQHSMQVFICSETCSWLIFFSSSTTCQTKHWNVHKLKCKEFKLEKTADLLPSPNSRKVSLVPARGTCKVLQRPKKVTDLLFLNENLTVVRFRLFMKLCGFLCRFFSLTMNLLSFLTGILQDSHLLAF